jgi:DNA-binding transcriptional ArsR family regulator
VSQHLKVLKLAGLVADRPDSNRRLYAIDPDGLAELRASIELFWQDALTRFVALSEAADDSESRR